MHENSQKICEKQLEKMPENIFQNVCEKVISGVSAIINIETEKRGENHEK